MPLGPNDQYHIPQNQNPPFQDPHNQEPFQRDEVERQEQHGEFEHYCEDNVFEAQFNRSRGQPQGRYWGRGGRNGPIPQGGRYYGNQDQGRDQGGYYGNQGRDWGQGDQYGDHGRNERRDTDLNSIKVTLPILKGESDPKVYKNWKLQCERIFQTNDFTKVKKST